MSNRIGYFDLNATELNKSAQPWRGLHPGDLHPGDLPNPRGVCPIPGGLPNPRVSAQPQGDLPNPGGVCIQGICIQGGLPNSGGSASKGSAQPQVFPIPGGLPNPRVSAQPQGVCPTLGVCRGSASRGVCLHTGALGRPLIPVNRMTHRCKNITLPQTSFAGGN